MLVVLTTCEDEVWRVPGVPQRHTGQLEALVVELEHSSEHVDDAQAAIELNCQPLPGSRA